MAQQKNQKKYARRRKGCRYCKDKVESIDFKDPFVVRKLTSPYTGKILGKKKTGTCARHQRMVAQAVKRARMLGIIPFVVE